MSEAFNRAFEAILDAEGHTPPFGISKRWNPDVDVDHLTVDQARQIYHDRYWAPVRGDQLPEPLGLMVVDAAVQHDPVDGARFFQQALNRATGSRLKADGDIATKTLAAAAAAAARGQMLRETLVRYLAIRGVYYAHLVALRPKDEANHDGWLCRLFRLQARALDILERCDGGAGAQGGDRQKPSPLAETGPASPSGRSERRTEDQ